MNLNIRPLHDRIVVKRLAQETKTKSGIIIPETAQKKSFRGEVVSTGKGKRNEDGTVTPMDVKPGDVVLFGEYAGSEFKIDGTQYLMMREDEIYGVLLN